MNLKKTKSILLLFLIILVPFINLIPVPNANAALVTTWWNFDWNYRSQIIITGSTVGALTNYPIKITMVSATGICNESTIYTNGSAQADYGDVRFLNDAQDDLLSYWMVDNSSWTFPNATMWVNVTSIPASPDTTSIWVYWGNAAVNTLSDGSDVFPFFDDMQTDPTGNPDWLTGDGGVPAYDITHYDWYTEIESGAANGGYSWMKGTKNLILAGGSDTYGWSMEWDNAIMSSGGNENFNYYGAALADAWGHVALGMDEITSGIKLYWQNRNPFANRYLTYAEYDAAKALKQSDNSVTGWAYENFANYPLPAYWTNFNLVMFGDSSYILRNETQIYSFATLDSSYLTKGLDPSFSAHGKAGDNSVIYGFVNWVFFRPIADPEPVTDAEPGESITLTVGIHNRGGDGNWIFEGRTQWLFWVNVSASMDVGSAISAGIGFYDASGDFYSFYWDYSNGLTTLASPQDGISATYTGHSTGDTWVFVNFTVMINPTIADTMDVDLYVQYETPSLGLVTWTLKSTDYVHIYNLGGYSTLTSTGWAGRSDGGDVFEIYASDTRVAKMFYESFELQWNYFIDAKGDRVQEQIPIPWVINQDPPYSNITGTDRYPNENSEPYANYGSWRDGVMGLRIQTNDATNKISWAARQFLRPVNSENVTTTVWWQSPLNASTSRLKWSTTPTYLGNDDEVVNIQIESIISAPVGMIRVEIADNVFVVGDAAGVNPITWVTDTWYNITVVMNMTSQSWTLFWNRASTNITSKAFADTGPAPTQVEWFTALGANGLGGGEQSDFFIDAINTTTDFTGNYGGDVTATTLYNRLQHWSMDFDLDVEDGYVAYPYADFGFIELGWDVCLNGTWEDNILVARINITSADIPSQITGIPGIVQEAIKAYVGGKANWVRFNIEWTQNGTYLKNDTLYGLYEGYGNLVTTDGAKNTMGFHWDMWFNSINASSVIGGRINLEWFGMADDTSGVASIWNSNWKPMVSEVTDSTAFIDLVDKDGDVHTAKEVSLVRSWVRVWRSNDDTFHYEIKNVEGLDFRRTTEVMSGIDTPVIIPTSAPNAPTGFGGSSFGAMFKSVMETFSNSIVLGALSMWTTFVSFIDVVAAYFGFSNALSTIFGMITSSMTFLNLLISENYLFSMIGNIFTVISSTAGHILYWLTKMITSLQQVFSIVWAIIDGTYAGAGAIKDLWATFGWAEWSDAVPLFALIAWMSSLDDRWRKNNRSGWLTFLMGDIKVIITLMTFFLTVAGKVIDLSIGLVEKIINMIPVL